MLMLGIFLNFWLLPTNGLTKSSIGLLRGLQSRNLSSSDDDGRDSSSVASGVVFFVAIAACILWCCGPSIIECLKSCYVQCYPNSARRAQDERSQREFERAFGSMIRSVDEADRVRAVLMDMIDVANGATTATNGMVPVELTRRESRRRYIERMLMSEKYLAEKETTTITAIDRGHDNKTKAETLDQSNNENVDETKSSMDEPQEEEDFDEDQADTCVICLNAYQAGDIIAWSHNQQCPHKFHRQCIAEWLAQHDECPVCRNPFLLSAEGCNLASLGSSDFDYDNDPYNDTTAQLLRGLEIFYREQAASGPRFPPFSIPPARRENNMNNYNNVERRPWENSFSFYALNHNDAILAAEIRNHQQQQRQQQQQVRNSRDGLEENIIDVDAAAEVEGAVVVSESSERIGGENSPLDEESASHTETAPQNNRA